MKTAGTFIIPCTPVRVMFERRMRPLVRNSQPEPIEHAIGVLAPGDGDRRRGDGVFENQIPADDPRDQFAHGRVRVGVGAAGHRDHRGELGVTETGKGAADAGDDEGEHNRWTRAIGNRRRGAHKQDRRR